MIGHSNLDFSPYPSASNSWVRDVKVTYFPAHLNISDQRSNFWDEWVQFESQYTKLPRIFYTQKQTSMFHYAIKSKHKQFNFHVFFPFCVKSLTAAQVLLNNPFHNVSSLSSQGSSVFQDHCMTELNKITAVSAGQLLSWPCFITISCQISKPRTSLEETILSDPVLPISF